VTVFRPFVVIGSRFNKNALSSDNNSQGAIMASIFWYVDSGGSGLIMTSNMRCWWVSAGGNGGESRRYCASSRPPLSANFIFLALSID
jgi:hypothetical protein